MDKDTFCVFFFIFSSSPHKDRVVKGRGGESMKKIINVSFDKKSVNEKRVMGGDKFKRKDSYLKIFKKDA